MVISAAGRSYGKWWPKVTTTSFLVLASSKMPEFLPEERILLFVPFWTLTQTNGLMEIVDQLLEQEIKRWCSRSEAQG